ncbi:MAG: HPr family phosphocarrier protein [Planctomycetes bacterium]|nr:HPr family phosphocarrier protein [Planctomycetota bacterium]
MTVDAKQKTTQAIGEWLERRISLKNKHGLHMRPAQKIVETASQFECEVHACKDALDMNSKSILDMIEFAAYMVNAAAADDNEFTFRARGPGAEQALEALFKLVDDRFGLE